MSLAPEPYASRRDTVAFLTCLLLAVVARAAPADYTATVASLLRSSILAPLVTLQHETELLRVRRREFETLLAQRDSAIAFAEQMEPLAAENLRLRSILGLRQRMPVRHVSGEVLHHPHPAGEITLLLTVGANQGVREWAPVVSPRGLVGHIQSVDAETSVALAWTHPDFRASATVMDSIAGIVVPRIGAGATSFLELREVAHRAEIPSGTIVHTAGLGGVYPRGIPIGRVRELVEEREGWSKTYLVEPVVHPATVSHVLVLLADGVDLRRAFSSAER